MYLEDEQDYIMRMIRQMVRALFSVILGKKYQMVEFPDENKYNVSGKPLEDYLQMIDNGLINESENMILEKIDYGNKEDIAALLIFYDHISQKEESFLEGNNYSAEEVLEGLKAIASETGLGEIGTFLINKYSEE